MQDGIDIDFMLGARRLLSVRCNLSTWAFTLEDMLGGDPMRLRPETHGPDGLRVLSAPSSAVDAIAASYPDLILGARQDFRRHFIAMDSTFEEYMAGFSGKTRSTFRRKGKKLAKECGEFRVLEYRTPEEIAVFLDKALPLSAKTYQARQLDMGLPDTPEDREAMLRDAADDRMRCFILEADGNAISYLALPVVGRTLIYAHLGYDPEFGRFSPGTILQLEALERLFAEQRFAYLDFTEGDGAHKEMFGTDSVPGSSFVLLEATLSNRALLTSRSLFDASVGAAKSLAERTGMLSKLRSALKS